MESPLDQPQDPILDDLRDLVTGEVLGDDVSLAVFSTDASLLQVRPRVVVAQMITPADAVPVGNGFAWCAGTIDRVSRS